MSEVDRKSDEMSMRLKAEADELRRRKMSLKTMQHQHNISKTEKSLLQMSPPTRSAALKANDVALNEYLGMSEF